MKKEIKEKIKDWEEDFDVEFDADMVIHLFETEQFQRIKSFIRQLLKDQDYQDTNWLLKKFNLTINNLPAFPPKDIDLKELIFAVGIAKLKQKWDKDRKQDQDKWHRWGWKDCEIEFGEKLRELKQKWVKKLKQGKICTNCGAEKENDLCDWCSKCVAEE